MKKILFLLSFVFLSLVSFSQTTGYGGIIYDEYATLASIRPYINARLSEKELGGLNYYTIVGAGMNSLGNISVSVGFDLTTPISKNEEIKGVAGFSLELLGWDEVHQDYMPSFRFGIETKRFMLLGLTNQKFKTFLLGDVKGYDPSLSPTVGLFYKIK